MRKPMTMSISYLNLSDKITTANLGAMIFDERLCHATRTRPGMIQLIVKILDGGISDDVMIITCPN
jgi:hypothetical protein